MEPVGDTGGVKFKYEAAKFTLGGSNSGGVAANGSSKPAIKALQALASLPSSAPAVVLQGPVAGLVKLGDAFPELAQQLNAENAPSQANGSKVGGACVGVCLKQGGE